MGFRFRKSFKIAPGVRLNVGKRGLGMSVGPRGSSVSISSRGVYGNVGIPGTGLSYRGRLDGPGARRPARSQGVSQVIPDSAVIALQDDGRVEIRDANGNPLPPRIAKLARQTNGAQIQTWLEEQCDQWNKGIEEILNLHLQTPPPTKRIVFTPTPMPRPEPTPPTLREHGLLSRIFRSWREAIDRENGERQAAYTSELANWKVERQRHETRQAALRQRIEVDRLFNPDTMQEFLAEALGGIDWPRETQISLEVDPMGRTVMLDVDLPEIEDMPTEQASVAARGLKLNIKPRSETQRRKEYMTHVHAIAFRMIGESFVALPTAQTVICSGYSQRANKATGVIADEYLFSVRVPRSEWERIDFWNLASLELPTCLGGFDLRRKMTSTGVFTPITPFSA